jgi:hypothetical protein
VPTRLSVSSAVAQLVSACGGLTQSGAYLGYFSNLSDAVLDVYADTLPTYRLIYYPRADPSLLPFTWENAEVYVQTTAEKQIPGPVDAYLVPVGGSIMLGANSPVHIRVQIDQNATAESRAAQLLVDYTVDNLKEEVPKDSIISYSEAITSCVNSAYMLWTSLNQENSEGASTTISNALTANEQCKDLQEKLKDDPESDLHVPEMRRISTEELDQKLSKIADHAEQDDWPAIIDDLSHDAGRVAEELHR